MHDPRDSVPLTVIGGYLGAGKTTVINSLLREPGGRRLGVVVNDFGSLAIDAALLGGASEGLVSLPNGCVCCTLGGDLQSALASLMDAASPPDQIVIEVSGVADPAATAAWGTVPPFMPGGVIVLADASTVRKRSRDRYVGGEILRQLEGADLIILTKSDLTSTDELAETEEWVDGVAGDVPRLVAAHGDVPTDIVLGVRAGHSRPIGADPIAHSDRYVQWSWSVDRSIDAARLARFIDELPDTVLRAKGLVKVGPATVSHVEVVGRRRYVSPWKGAVPHRSEMVVIGLRGVLDIAELSGLADRALG
ncbi:MAG: GTP-binding protein [Acidimicrobiia bacterium]|nr:GTP-binding protein [Acidimicrobiia bacterium]